MDRLEAAAQELAAKTGQKCIPLQADVRMPAQLQAAAKRAVEEFGKIDFVICGTSLYLAPCRPHSHLPGGRRGGQLYGAHLRHLGERVPDRHRDRHGASPRPRLALAF
jgi:NAD(P)-dependent dehydrogenase (short-subunit alcohol dehydrogenase family)